MKGPNVIEKELIIPGLRNTYRILHITDAHITMYVDEDENTIIRGGYHKGKHLVSGFAAGRVPGFTKDGITSNERFARLCDALRDAGAGYADLVVFTGDLLDFYTDTAFAFMMEQIEKLPMPYFFVVGNHDWIFSNHTDAETLDIFAKTLCGGSYKVQKYKLGELTLVGAYNAQYTYDRETFSLLEEALEGEENVLLCQHVPINSPAFEADHIAKRPKNNIVVIGARDWAVKDDSYERIMALLEKEDCKVKALLCGDSHMNHTGPLTERTVQFVSPILRDYAPVLFTIKGN